MTRQEDEDNREKRLELLAARGLRLPHPDGAAWLRARGRGDIADTFQQNEEEQR